jgi:hypothetical protein
MNQIQKNYKIKDTTEFLKVWHEYQDQGEKKEREEKNSSLLNRCQPDQTRHSNSYTTTLHIR